MTVMDKPKVGAEQLKRSVKLADIEPMMAAIAPVIKETIARALAPLEARIRELEAKPALKYCGVWRQGEIYNTGDFTTDHGSLWHAKSVTLARPGTDDTWQLAVKRGRDAK